MMFVSGKSSWLSACAVILATFGGDHIPRCSGDVPTLTPDDFEKHLRETLEEIRKSIPKVFVNLVPLGNISEVCPVIYVPHAYTHV